MVFHALGFDADTVLSFIANATQQAILSANGLSDGVPKDTINLNNLDDWHGFHAAEIA